MTVFKLKIFFILIFSLIFCFLLSFTKLYSNPTFYVFKLIAAFLGDIFLSL